MPASTKKRPTSKKSNSSGNAKRSPSSGAVTDRKLNKPPAKTELQLLREKEIAGIVLVALSVVLLVNFILAPGPGEAEAGSIGVLSSFLNKLLYFCAGRGAFVLPVCMLVYGILVCMDKNCSSNSRLTGLLLMFCAFLGLLHLGEELKGFVEYISLAAEGLGGGIIGALLDFVLLKILGRAGTIIIFIALLLIGLLLFFQTTLVAMLGGLRRGGGKVREVLETEIPLPERSDFRWPQRKKVSPVEAPLIGEGEEKASPAAAEAAPARSSLELPDFLPDGSEKAPRKKSREKSRFSLPQEEAQLPAAEAAAAPAPAPVKEESGGIIPPETPFVWEYMPSIGGKSSPAAAGCTAEKTEAPLPLAQPEAAAEIEEIEEKIQPPIFGLEDAEAEPEEAPFAEEIPSLPEEALPEDESPAADAAEAEEELPAAAAAETGEYILPPVELIEAGIKVKNPRMNKLITDSIGVLESTLESFGVRATVTQVVAGPAVTRYELQPAPGVKVSRITSLADDIALTLAAQSVRIEAPIPGKSAIGIEVSRKEVDTVYFREMIESDNFRDSRKMLSFVLGKNIAGECVVADLGKMPHLLIAGTTGSGKSVCVNTLICSLLYKARPDQVKLMLIDPKKVELMQYAKLPHLIAPVVNDSKKAANALKWVVEEMDSRYSLFVSSLVKDFEGYNKVHAEDPLPHIVVIIDELADLMLVARHDVEDSICRIAQMARAAGIHLVVATQRPSVDVITGLIKSNIPSRIAFAVSSFTDSRTILDMGGAEKLVGRGDMLFAPVGVNKPMRIQGSFIDPADVNRLVGYCAAQASPSFSQAAVAAASTAEKASSEREDGEDELLYDAGSLIISSGQASVSYLQRRLAIGNPRAARLMDMLERKGVVGCSKGSKPRDILMSMAEFEELFA